MLLPFPQGMVLDTHGHPTVGSMHTNDHERGRHGHGQHGHEVGQADLLDLDAEVLAELNTDIVDSLPAPPDVRRLVDLGAGTGAGTFALLARFPDAEVVAVDSSAEHLDRLAGNARARGVADRVRTVRADLDAAWPDLGAPDLVWASSSLHHLADPDRTLRRVYDLLGPGGLFAVVELAGFPRFLPDDAPADRPGLEARCHAISDRYHAEHVPLRGADWGPMLTAAGFVVDGTRTVTVDSGRSGSAAVGRYALASLQRLHASVADALPAADLAALDRLLDPAGPDGIARRTDLTVRTQRSVWAARRP
jgi:SAM-dependent methyltransferase